jgi:hypothetical protein
MFAARWDDPAAVMRLPDFELVEGYALEEFGFYYW